MEGRGGERGSRCHSAFRIPHSALGVVGCGAEDSPRGRRHGGALDARARARVGAARGIEAQVLPRYPFRHHLLPMEPIYRRTWWNNVRSLLTAGRAWRAVGRVLDAEQPVIVLGTGGYAAGPVVWRAQ